MITVVEALIVTLGLDGSKFKAGSKDAETALKKTKENADRTAKEMEAAGKNAAAFFTKLRNEALLFFGVFTAGRSLKNFAEDTIANAASLGRLSDNLQMSVEDLSSFQRASERAGGSVAGITAQLQESQRAVAMFKTGMSDDSMLWFYNLGGSASAFKDAKTYLLARADIIAKTNATDPGRAQLQAQQMGISPEQFNLIKKGSAGILELVAAQEKNSRFTRQQAEEAANLENKMRDLKDRIAVTATAVLVALIPAMERAGVALQKLADWVADHKDDITKWVTDAANAIGGLIVTLNKGAEAVGGWKNVLIALAGLRVLAMVSSFVALAGAIGQIGLALGVVAANPAGLVVLGAVAAAVGGYKLAEALFGKKENEAEPEQQAPDPKSLTRLPRDVLRAEAARQLKEALAIAEHNGSDAGTIDGLKKRIEQFAQPDADLKHTIRLKSKDELRAASAAELQVNPSTVQAITNQLLKAGWTQVQAAGIVANLKQESGLNPRAVGDSGLAYGLAQWHPDRQADFKAKFGKDIRDSSVAEQVDFITYELRQGKEQNAGRALSATTAPGQSGAVVSDKYLRPGVTAEAQAAEAIKRAAAAENIYTALRANNAIAAAQAPAQTVVATNAQPITNKSTGSSTSETNINGPITVNTQATDAAGVARSLGDELKKYNWVGQANTGIL